VSVRKSLPVFNTDRGYPQSGWTMEGSRSPSGIAMNPCLLWSQITPKPEVISPLPLKASALYDLQATTQSGMSLNQPAQKLY